MGEARRDTGPAVPPGSPLTGPGFFKPISAALERLHSAGTKRDNAGNRRLFCDQYVSLLLLYFFNSSITSLRGLRQATGWDQARRTLGIPATSLGSLSEAQRVFDAELLEPIIAELAGAALPLCTGKEAEALKGLTAVDGTFFAALPRMAWALWQDERHRGAKLHLHFDVLKGVPRAAGVTPAAGSEAAELARTLEENRLYVLDRGYANYELFAAVLAAGSSFVARVQDRTAYREPKENPIGQEAHAAGVVRDFVAHRLGNGRHGDPIGRPVRIVVVRVGQRGGERSDLWLATDRLDLPADLVALAYKYRWTIELFFRWLKCILGARHLIAHSPNGVQLQMYAALIVSLLIVLRTGRKPTKRTYEMIQFYLLGWVSDAEFDAHLAKLKRDDAGDPQKNG